MKPAVLNITPLHTLEMNFFVQWRIFEVVDDAFHTPHFFPLEHFSSYLQMLWGMKYFNLSGTSIQSTVGAIPFTLFLVLVMILTVIPAIPNERNDPIIPTAIPTPTPVTKIWLACSSQSEIHRYTERWNCLTTLHVHVCCRVNLDVYAFSLM